MAILWGERWTAGFGTVPEVVALADGRFAVIYTDIEYNQRDNASYTTAVMARIFNADGSAAGPEILLADTSSDGYYDGAPFYRPSIAPTSDGGFVAAWTEFNPDNQGIPGQVCIQAYDQNGMATGPQIRPPAKTDEISVAERPDGKLSITWIDKGRDTVYARDNVLKEQVYNADGSPAGAVTSIGSAYGFVETKVLADGRMAMIFTRDAPGSGRDVEAVLLISDANGQFDPTKAIYVSQFGWVVEPKVDVTQLGNGNMVVTWSTGEIIGGRLFDPNGVPLSPELRLDLPSGLYLGDVAIAPLQDGGFVGVWANRIDDNYTHDPLYQLFFADGSRNGGPVSFAPGSGRSGAQSTFNLMDVDVLPDGRFVVVWTGAGLQPQIVDPRTGAVELVASDIGSQLIGTSFDDTLTGGVGEDRLEGDYGADLISGGAGSDFLDGGGGGDTLDGGLDDDWMRGGPGDDVFRVDSLGDMVSENADGGVDIIQTSLDGFTLTAANVEGLELQGSADLTAYGDGRGNYLYGNAGSNALYGQAGDDLLDGGAGADFLDGGVGDDWMRGGAGDDVFIVDSFGDLLSENAGEGVDIVRTSLDGFILFAPNVEGVELQGSGDLTVYGDGRSNHLYGNVGDNSLFGDAGDDLLDGGGGNDGYLGGPGDDILRDLGGGDDAFVFNWDFGRDVVIGFEAGAEIGDVIVLQRSTFADLDAVLAAWSDDGAGNTVIDAGGGNTITILGVTTAQFAANDFLLE